MTLRAAIVGCGKIAEQHAEAIARLPHARLVGVCDLELRMAQQLGERHDVPQFFDDVGALLATAKPQVVHITTPPASHYPLALQCLDAGCHVYVEKPFTLNAAEAEGLLKRARERGLYLTAGHNLQHTWEQRDARQLIRDGFLGGAPIHIESYYTYALGDGPYAKALLGDAEHWVRRLPGQLLHNIISHGIARIAEFLDTDDPFVAAFGHTSPALEWLGERAIIDELRVHISDRRNMTAAFVFSSQLSPPVNGARIYGPTNSLVIDSVHRTVTRIRQHNHKSYINYVVPPVHAAIEQLINVRRNVGRFLRAEFHDDSGVTNCIGAFYASIREQRDTAQDHRQILLTALIMDRIFAQLPRSLDAGSGTPRPSTEHSLV